MTTKTVIANGKTYNFVSGSTEKGIVVAEGPRGGKYNFVQNIKSGRWSMITPGLKPRTVWLDTFEVVDK